MEKARRLRKKPQVSYEVSSDSEDELAPSEDGSAFSSPGKSDQIGIVVDLISEDELAETSEPPPRKTAADHSLRQRKDLHQSLKALSNADRPRKKIRRLHRAPQALPLAKVKSQAKPRTERGETRYLTSKENTRKRDNFLKAHQKLFLPLLPEYNYIVKLREQSLQRSASGKEAHEVQYEVLNEQPAGVKAVMKPYQLLGLSFLVYMYRNGASAILGDEMGLGKTLQTLSLIQYLKEKHPPKIAKTPRPSLVICPLSVLSSWISEAGKWTPGLKVLRFHGAMSERDRLKRVAMGDIDRYGNETSFARKKRQIRRTARGQPVIELSSSDESGDTKSIDLVITTYEVFLAEQTWFKKAFFWN